MALLLRVAGRRNKSVRALYLSTARTSRFGELEGVHPGVQLKLC